MSNRLSKEKAQAIATEYCTNGHKKVLAMLAIGYSESYARTGEGLKTYDNPLVKQEIAKIQAKIAQKTGWSIEKAQTMLLETRDRAVQANQPAVEVSSVVAINRMFGLDKDGGSKDTVTVINVVNYAGAAGVEPPKQVESEVIDG